MAIKVNSLEEGIYNKKKEVNANMRPTYLVHHFHKFYFIFNKKKKNDFHSTFPLKYFADV